MSTLFISLSYFENVSPKCHSPCLRWDSAAKVPRKPKVLTNGVFTTCGWLAKRSTARQSPSRNAAAAPKHGNRPGALGSSDEICSLRGLSDALGVTTVAASASATSGTPATSSAFATFATSTPCSEPLDDLGVKVKNDHHS